MRGERPIFRHSSLCRRSSFRPALSGIWRPSSSADLIIVRMLRLLLLLRDRMGTAPLQTGLLSLCGVTGRAYRGAFRRAREVCADTASIRCGDGERPAAGWDRTVNRMEGRRSGDGAGVCSAKCSECTGTYIRAASSAQICRRRHRCAQPFALTVFSPFFFMIRRSVRTA